MEIELPQIDYKYPETVGEHPLDTNSNSKFFIYATGFSYLSSTLEPFKNIYFNYGVHKVIPMGYNTLHVNERLDIFRQSKMIKRFEEESEENIIKYFRAIKRFEQESDENILEFLNKYKMRRYCIFSNNPIFYNGYHKKYVHMASKNDKWGVGDTTWDSREEAIDFCKYLYNTNKILDVLIVCREIESVSWH